MVQQRSFQKYVSKHHENDLFDAVASFIPDNLDEIHLWSYNIDVDNLDEENVSFDDMKVEQVFVNEETLTNDIEFDVLVSGAIYFSECDRHNDYEDSCNAWFRVNCRATIDGELKNFKVHDVETYDKKKNRFHRRLSDALVPIISSEDVEFEAEQFLTMYFPEAMEIPQRVDPLLIAEKMGLTVEYHEISEDGNIFGQIYFHDALLDGKEIKAKTILIDPRVIESRGIGGLNNTIMHECVHWHKHRLAFELVRLFQPELSNITTSVDEFKEIVTSNMTPTDWMELQARVITPKILMPRKMVAQEIEMKQRELSAQGVSDLDATKLKIEYLAGYFGVSILSAKIRMVELGYEEAIGAFNYIDGDYVPLHRWKKGALEANQT
ncbi:ImmA/IrrE family metallo-endopeptidase, partial [Enterococcus faecalis]